MLRKATIAVLTVAAVGGAGLPLMTASAAETGSISGVTFQDTNRNGVQDAGEAVWSGHVLYLFDENGGYVRAVQSDAHGRYTFTSVPTGTYDIEYAADRWWELRETWVPTTTGSVLPKRRVTVSGSTAADFGWRPIVRSTTAGQPVTSFTGPSGLRVESYNDVLTAAEVHDVLVSGTIGREAPSVVVRFAFGGSSTTSTSIGATAGRYDRFAAYVYVTWLSWLDTGSSTLAHEYGHAWGMYRAYLVQQDPQLAGYLQARGVAADDPRLDTNHAWGRDELLAEDYRQLLGPPSARTGTQANSDLRVAADVPGLRDYLLGTFTSSTSPAPSASPSPTSSTSPSPSAPPTPSSSPSPSPSPTATASPTPISSPNVTASPSPTSSPASRKGGGCKRGC